MSPNSSIKRVRSGDRTGFHLYDDLLDTFGAGVAAPEPPVHLRIDGVSVQLEPLDSGGASVTVAIARALTRELGLLPLEDGLSPAPGN